MLRPFLLKQRSGYITSDEKQGFICARTYPPQNDLYTAGMHKKPVNRQTAREFGLL